MDCPIVKQVTEAFLVFDLERKETVDVREVGTIIRSLGNNLCHLNHQIYVMSSLIQTLINVALEYIQKFQRFETVRH